MDRVKQMKDARTTGGKLRAIGGIAGSAVKSLIKRGAENLQWAGGKRTAKVGQQAAANRSTPSQSKMAKAVRASGRTQKIRRGPESTIDRDIREFISADRSSRRGKQPRNPRRGGSR